MGFSWQSEWCQHSAGAHTGLTSLPCKARCWCHERVCYNLTPVDAIKFGAGQPAVDLRVRMQHMPRYMSLSLHLLPEHNNNNMFIQSMPFTILSWPQWLSLKSRVMNETGREWTSRLNNIHPVTSCLDFHWSHCWLYFLLDLRSFFLLINMIEKTEWQSWLAAHPHCWQCAWAYWLQWMGQIKFLLFFSRAA